jgi:hypothetical protein
MNLGKKVPPPPPPPEPEWKPYPGDPRMEVNAQGQLRTKIPPPPAVWVTARKA